MYDNRKGPDTACKAHLIHYIRGAEGSLVGLACMHLHCEENLGRDRYVHKISQAEVDAMLQVILEPVDIYCFLNISRGIGGRTAERQTP